MAGCFYACQAAVLPKLLPNPIQSQERALSADTTTGSRGSFILNWFFGLPARYHSKVMESSLGHRGSAAGLEDSQVA